METSTIKQSRYHSNKKMQKVKKSRKKHQKPPNSNCVSFVGFCMGYQINKRKFVNRLASLLFVNVSFTSSAYQELSLATSLYELFCHLRMFSYHFVNVLVHLHSGATSYVYLLTSSIPKTS